MIWLADFLSQVWWQGVGGIAQAIAAVLALIAIKQARKMLRLAEEERRFAVAPDWDIQTAEARPGWRKEAGDPTQRHGAIQLWNSGLGSARKPTIGSAPFNGNRPIQSDCRGMGPKPYAVRPGNLLAIDIWWNVDRPLDGLLTLTCETRLGQRVSSKFHLLAWTEEDGEPHLQLDPPSILIQGE